MHSMACADPMDPRSPHTLTPEAGLLPKSSLSCHSKIPRPDSSCSHWRGKEMTLERVFPKLQHCPLAHTMPRLSQKASLSEFLLHTGPENSTGSRTVPWTQPKLPLLSPNPCTEAKGSRSHQPSHLPAWKGPDIGLIQRRVFLAHLQTASAAPREPITREQNKRKTVAISSSVFSSGH